MAVGFPQSTSYANGDVLTAANVNDITGTLNLLSDYYTGNPTLIAPFEKVNVVAAAATGTINIDCNTSGTIWYYTSNSTANFTLNFRSSSTVALNTALQTGESVSVVFLNTNGATAYYPTAFQIDGTSVTPKWSGGTAPSAGNASSIDAYTFTIIKTASATYTVLAGGAVKFA